jgi:hypothetical protein
VFPFLLIKKIELIFIHEPGLLFVSLEAKAGIFFYIFRLDVTVREPWSAGILFEISKA